jgi:uncharacterized membrane protein YgdD (TMEM256/DUF423 family)
MKKANKWIGLGIIAVIALVQGVGFGQAFVMLDAKFISDYPAFASFLVGAGLALGLAIEAGIAYAAATYPGMRGKKELQLTQGALACLLAIAPLVLTPVRLYSMDAGLKASMWPVIAGGVVFGGSVHCDDYGGRGEPGCDFVKKCGRTVRRCNGCGRRCDAWHGKCEKCER